ncbi:hypothetical protein RvY_19070 [Ramazzottius varieornatus]|uniref:Uncharacterized protein n=1 Tax=Ramazzottius varieornatus TaxID=947166 RepID=A0A1D1WAI0_RAMVA|nr:hypothetical protein RvY_19070 [Ramazzottius varieornatus]
MGCLEVGDFREQTVSSWTCPIRPTRRTDRIVRLHAPQALGTVFDKPELRVGEFLRYLMQRIMEIANKAAAFRKKTLDLIRFLIEFSAPKASASSTVANNFIAVVSGNMNIPMADSKAKNPIKSSEPPWKDVSVPCKNNLLNRPVD